MTIHQGKIVAVLRQFIQRCLTISYSPGLYAETFQLFEHQLLDDRVILDNQHAQISVCQQTAERSSWGNGPALRSVTRQRNREPKCRTLPFAAHDTHYSAQQIDKSLAN